MLTIKHCKEVMNQEMIIGDDKAKDGVRKRFTFNPWMNEYSVWVGNWHTTDRLNGGQAIEELLEEYNEL